MHLQPTQLGSRSFEYPLIMNAAGMFKTLDTDVLIPATRFFDVVIGGSITPQARVGNKGKTEDLQNNLYGLNSWGMPNLGATHFPQTDPLIEQEDYPIMASVAGFGLADYQFLFDTLLDWGMGLELNLGCPNVRDFGHQTIISFDPIVFEEILLALQQTIPLSTKLTQPIIGVKLSPYSDPGMLSEVASLIAEFDIVSYVATCNTFANGMGFDQDGCLRILTDEAGYYGGISGEALKPISLGNAAKFRELLPENIAVIRVGGVSSARDVWESYEVGCGGVQIGTAFAREGAGLISQIRTDLVDLHEQRGDI